MAMQSRAKAVIFNVLGLLLCVVPPVIATLEHFPVWISKGGEVFFSGITVILLLVCAIPFKRQLTEFFRSPSAWFLWLCIFIISTLLIRIADDISAIALVSFVSNAIGAVFFKLGKKHKERQ